MGRLGLLSKLFSRLLSLKCVEYSCISWLMRDLCCASCVLAILDLIVNDISFFN